MPDQAALDLDNPKVLDALRYVFNNWVQAGAQETMEYAVARGMGPQQGLFMVCAIYYLLGVQAREADPLLARALAHALTMDADGGVRGQFHTEQMLASLREALGTL